MDYKSADQQLQGRCQQSRKLENNTYLQRRGPDAIAVLLHATDILTFYEDGSIVVNTGGWDTVTTRSRINEFLDRPFSVYGERGATILSNYRWTPVHRKHGTEHCRRGTVEVILENSATILPKGKVDGGGSVEEYREEIRKADNERKREASRLNRWLRKARGLHIDNSACTKKDSWCSCHLRHGGWGLRHRNLPTQTGTCEQCGCRVYFKQPDPGRLTVQHIMAEPNISIRVAKMKVFGFELFFLEANPKVLDEQRGYQLLELPLDTWNRMRALKMECPSTKVIYLSPVEPRCSTVPEALDWMFNTEDYLGQLAQEA